MQEKAFAFDRWVPGLCAAAVALALGHGCGGNDNEEPGPRRAALVYAGRPPVPTVQLPLHASARLHPVEPGRVKEVRLDVSNGLVDLGAEGKFAGWSFGGRIPGPTVRLREGDRVHFTMTNRTDEPVAGLEFSADAQSIDVGGVMIDHADEHRTLAPGETLELEFTAMAPGVHMYKGGLPTAIEAVAAGMYGMVVVDPAAGYGTAADREFAVIQGELYAHPDPAARKMGEKVVEVMDRDALLSKRPSHFGYGGHFAAGTGLRLPAEPGERLRLFVLNAGPYVTARFSLQGLPFAGVWPQEVMGPKPGPSGPATLLPGTGAIVEIVVPKKGRFRFVDQQLASRGLVGIIDAAQGEPEATNALVIAKPRTPAERRERGHELFVERCVSCHEPPAGAMRLAPDLAGVLQRRNRTWLTSWLTDPPKMQASDPIAQDLMKQWNNLPMPQVMLAPDQIEWVLEFLGAPVGKKS